MKKEITDFLDRIGIASLCPEGVQAAKDYAGTGVEFWQEMTKPQWMLRYARKAGVPNEDLRAIIDEINSIPGKEKIAAFDCGIIRKHLTPEKIKAARIKKNKELDDMEKDKLKYK